MTVPVHTTGSLRPDGHRLTMYPADVAGRWTTGRNVLFVVLIGVYVALPFVYIGGHPAVFLDIPERRFHLFGGVFSARDIPMTVIFLIGSVFSLLVLTALLGRVWCGFACPQTVFIEAVYRRVERWIQGPRERRVRRNAGPITFDKAWRKGLTHALWIAFSLILAHVFLSYFVSMPALGQYVQSSPAEHPLAFGMVMVASFLLYFNFGWFREQFCVIACPYGRLQGVLVDDDTLSVGYDVKRGEPRGKVSARAQGAGDCVDCKRCVVVCPTGIDIRDGFQLDCVGCTACIDACDEVMVKVNRPTGLIRYDSLRGLRGEQRRFWRPRIWGYAAFAVIGSSVALFAITTRRSFEAHILRPPGIPFTVRDGVVYDPFDLHLINKRSEPATFRVRAEVGKDATATLPEGDIVIGPLEERHLPVTVSAPVVRKHGHFKVELEVRSGDEKAEVEARFLGPTGFMDKGQP
jgi:cytochrome c oxidase accessory protein FixG